MTLQSQIRGRIVALAKVDRFKITLQFADASKLEIESATPLKWNYIEAEREWRPKKTKSRLEKAVDDWVEKKRK